jgi:glutamine synthetase
VVFRYAVHMLAQRAGMTATFMPKPFGGRTGSGMHVHASLWSSSGAELFLEPDDPRGLGLSKQAYSFLAGVLDHAPGLAAITCPTVNSYKRLGAPTPRSGATWAPAYISYGGNNRTQMIRVPAPGRFEIRAVDGSANPYLAFAALLAAGMDGLDRDADPGEPNRDNLFALPPTEIAARGIRMLPPTLYHASEALLADPVLVTGLGKVRSGTYAEYFAEVKRDEFFEYHAQVSPWEVDHYLTLF